MNGIIYVTNSKPVSLSKWGNRPIIIMIRMSKGTLYELREQIAQKILSCLAASKGFSKYSRVSCDTERNCPLFAILAHYGLFGTSMSRNCCFVYGILRKSQSPTQDDLENIFCNLHIKIY